MTDTALPVQILDSLVDPVLVADTEHTIIYMRAVRDEAGEVVGYYERYEWKDA